MGYAGGASATSVQPNLATTNGYTRASHGHLNPSAAEQHPSAPHKYQHACAAQ